MINGFSFIGLPIEYSTKLPFNLSENLKINKPSKKQLKLIKSYLDELGSQSSFKRPFENKNVVEEKDDVAWQNERFIDLIPLKKKDWLYSVVEFKSEPRGFENPSQEIIDLRIAGLISEKKFVILRSFLTELKFGWGNNIESYDHLEQIFLEDKEYRWDKSDLLKLKKTYSEVENIRDNHPDIYHSLKLYLSIPKIVGYNELICLGLFSIIESVLTHNPKTGADSISHQIKTKVKLLSNRFDQEIDYSIFENVPVKTLWKKLYDFRSRIAHGGKIEFEKQFQILKSSYEVQVFLEKFLKTLLRNAITEPQLYTDLKEC